MKKLESERKLYFVSVELLQTRIILCY